MRVTVVSTYPPRSCGIAQFSRDLAGALTEADPSIVVDIVSMVRSDRDQDRADVVATIRQDNRSDYAAAAWTIRSRGSDVVLIEHEYGIFGGEDGSFVLSLADRLRTPLVVTLHTVPTELMVRKTETLRALCGRATLVTVFTETARRMVVEAQLVAPERVRVVPHGGPRELRPAAAPADAPVPPAVARRRHAELDRLRGRTVLSTFGLISSGKGIEFAIRALPAIRASHPDVLYLVAGQTHPEVIRREGERYRLHLERLARDLDLADHVHFLDRFLTVDELGALLSSTTVYLTPYRSEEQIVSGALTFAVLAGCPTVSTPYHYARDLLSSGAGVLVPFDDPDALAEGVLTLLDDPDALAAARAEADRLGRDLTWPAVGVQMLEVVREAVQLGPVGTQEEELLPALSSPRVRPDHLLTLVDDVGIVQHAAGVVPLRASGYCVDDAARLVIVALGLDRLGTDQAYARMATLGLAFLGHAWDPAGPGMHNVMSYGRQWLDEPHGGDHLGRAAWALGEVVAARPGDAVCGVALGLLEEMGPVLEAQRSARTLAFGVLGLSRPHTAVLPASLHDLLDVLSDRLAGQYRRERHEDWQWFEDTLTYDNARLPQALIAAGSRLGDEARLKLGLEALDWYSAQCALDSPVVRLVGNRWRRRGEPVPDGDEGDEQPLDAAALTEAHTEALAATGRREHGRAAVRAFEWFLGSNRLGVPVYDFATGGCHDGLGRRLNDNEGAESTLAYFQALLALDGAGLRASLPGR